MHFSCGYFGAKPHWTLRFLQFISHLFCYQTEISTPCFVYLAFSFGDTVAANDQLISYRLLCPVAVVFRQSFQHICVNQLLFSSLFGKNSWLLLEQHVQIRSINCVHNRISFSPTLCHRHFRGNKKYFLAQMPAYEVLIWYKATSVTSWVGQFAWGWVNRLKSISQHTIITVDLQLEKSQRKKHGHWHTQVPCWRDSL